MQPIRVYVPEVFTELSVHDARRMIRVAQELRRREQGFDYDGVILKLDTALQDGSDPDVEFEPGEDTAAARVLEHVRRGRDVSEALGTLRDRLIAWAGEQWPYDLVLVFPDGSRREKWFTSYAGPYRQGDVLPGRDEGHRWIVRQVDVPAEGGERLVCEPHDEEA